MTHNPIPEQGYLRIRQIIGDPKRGIPPLVPVSERSWWLGVKTGRFPPSVKLGPGTTVWRAEDVRRFLETGVSSAQG
ncbi:MAG TPA: AlpA family phage regulatory protein [Methylibium sp.]|uniref:helix-turn-helix transcriptional regulator n=1 Tax=Methylibium sp. TaxID=2067992 RepID=UPI002DBA9D3E|nr:AlpA family phage regulatory protein [Methylibium sp.]HEU4458124.1 AlpA family phage regulatory protein [Methylibium sp.]